MQTEPFLVSCSALSTEYAAPCLDNPIGGRILAYGSCFQIQH